ncbi:zinc transporter ZIP9 [Episyrphus balteatus]|uniref:zinc transporter ZIP9 n=1 Tax=Episyrphus balteatus TaxID=286459 RepID=UPI002485102A|nr:zinc transporter ZIP9 [Episyrphus balteatus]
MEETFILILLVMVMLVGSYLAGSIPLVMKLSEEKLKIVTVLGAGLLVGTALTVIIPEGIRSLYSSDIIVPEKLNLASNQIIASSEDTKNPSVVIEPAVPAAAYQYRHRHEEVDHSSTIGLSLVLGFVFMMLIDQISQRKSAANDQNITATLGLVVHAAADGVALGAAATTSHQDVEMIVFFAIMLHKAPAAFGLVSFLLHEKIERQQIRKHLAIFSLSAPLLTILTYFGIGQEQKETLNSVNATGIAMLFSAGTFLFVATVHVLPELTQGGHSHGGGGSGGFDNNPGVVYTSLEDASSTSSSVTKRPKGLKNSELIIMIFGALLPVVITFEHHH